MSGLILDLNLESRKMRQFVFWDSTKKFGFGFGFWKKSFFGSGFRQKKVLGSAFKFKKRVVGFEQKG